MVDQRNTSLSAPGYGNGRNSTASTTLKIAVLAPMPSASVTMAIKLNTGLRTIIRQPKRRSLINEDIKSVFLSASSALLVPQCLERLDAAGAPGREPARQQRCGQQQHRNANERTHVERIDAVQSRAHRPADERRTTESDQSSNNRQQRPFFQNHIDHARALRAERHAHTKLMRALRDRESHHAVNSHRRQDQSERSKARKQHDAETIDRQRLAYDLVDGLNTRQRHIGID